MKESRIRNEACFVKNKKEGEVWLYRQRWCWKMMVTNVPLRPVKPTPWLQMGPLHVYG